MYITRAQCDSIPVTIGSDNGLSAVRHQAIIWTNADILSIGPLGINFDEILMEIKTFSFKKMRLKMSSAKSRPFCLVLNVFSLLGSWDVRVRILVMWEENNLSSFQCLFWVWAQPNERWRYNVTSSLIGCARSIARMNPAFVSKSPPRASTHSKLNTNHIYRPSFVRTSLENIHNITAVSSES